MKRLIQACALTAIAMMAYSNLSAASGNDYYRWVDDRGNPVHSDRPPPKGTPYEVVSTGSTMVRQVDASEGAVPATTEPTVSNDFEQVNTAKPKIQKNPEQCKRAQENLETLNTKVRIQIRNDQGEVRALSDEEKEAQRKQATDAIAAHCE